jgi:hypothetical protein
MIEMNAATTLRASSNEVGVLGLIDQRQLLFPVSDN